MTQCQFKPVQKLVIMKLYHCKHENKGSGFVDANNSIGMVGIYQNVFLWLQPMKLSNVSSLLMYDRSSWHE